MNATEKKAKIVLTPIENGTAIDHLKPGSAPIILDVLNSNDQTITVAINAISGKMGRKDLIFIENRYLTPEQLDQVALLGQGATHNQIENGHIVRKERLDYPKEVRNILACQNPKCITNVEKIGTLFTLNMTPVTARCHYCEKSMTEIEIHAMIREGKKD